MATPTLEQEKDRINYLWDKTDLEFAKEVCFPDTRVKINHLNHYRPNGVPRCICTEPSQYLHKQGDSWMLWSHSQRRSVFVRFV